MSVVSPRAVIVAMSVTAGVCVANIYYNQPILNEIARAFHTSKDKIGMLSVLTQVGYGLGLFFITPLGDKISRKKMILILQITSVLALLGITMATGLTALNVMSLIVGITAVTPQVLMPMAASMGGENKGKTVSVVFTGVLVGVLSARVFSGYIAEWWGWRTVYAVSAGLVLITLFLMQLLLPAKAPTFKGSYLELLQSTFTQIKRFALLRKTAAIGALIFGVFCSFWTTATFHLGGEPFNYSADTIGLFGLLAISGALAAPAFGSLADRGNPARGQLITLFMLAVSVLLMMTWKFELWAFVLAVLLLDIGVQATQITNLSVIYTLDEKAHSRINTVYMTCYFIGGAIGTYVGVLCWKWGGWEMVTRQMLVWSAMAIVIAATGLKTKFRKPVTNVG